MRGWGYITRISVRGLWGPVISFISCERLRSFCWLVVILLLSVLLVAKVHAEATPKTPLEWDLTAIIYCGHKIDVPACSNYISFMGAEVNTRHAYYQQRELDAKPVALIRGVKTEDVDAEFDTLLGKTKLYTPFHQNLAFYCYYDGNRPESVAQTW